MNYDLSEINKALKDSFDSQNKAQQAKGELMRKLLVNKIAYAQEREMYKWKGQQEFEQKQRIAPFEFEQKRKEKLLPSAPSMNYKDAIFQEIRKKPQDQWENWEKQFMDTYTGGGDQAIVDAQGNIIGYRPKKSVFQPKGKGVSDSDKEFDKKFPGISKYAEESGLNKIFEGL